MHKQVTRLILATVTLILGGCATTLPDGSVDRELIPIRGMSGMPLVTVLPDNRHIYYLHVEKENARCFIIVKPEGKASYFLTGSSKRQHWVCVLRPPGQQFWVIVETPEWSNGRPKPIRTYDRKYSQEREAYVVGKALILKRARKY